MTNNNFSAKVLAQSITPLSITLLLIAGDHTVANKDHALDPKIIKAAMEVFLLHGFQAASIHDIAKRAEVTTGAIYTRYKSKDALFCSLVSNVLLVMNESSEGLLSLYEHAAETKNLEDVFSTIRLEEKYFIDMIFDYYDECTLLFCHSQGSSIEQMLKDMKTKKIQGTCAFMEHIAGKAINNNVVELIMNEGFSIYKHILQKGSTKKETIKLVESVNSFYEAGWVKFFEEIAN